MMKSALIAAALLTAGGLTAGCGGGSGSDAPQSASTKDFCDAYVSVVDQFSGGRTPSGKEKIKGMKDWADKMRRTGTPKGISDDARHGFEVTVDTIAKADDNASKDDLDKIGSDLSKRDEADAEAFGAYAVKTCWGQMKPELQSQMDDLESQMSSSAKP